MAALHQDSRAINATDPLAAPSPELPKGNWPNAYIMGEFAGFLVMEEPWK
jgi:hypothetical protein